MNLSISVHSIFNMQIQQEEDGRCNTWLSQIMNGLKLRKEHPLVYENSITPPPKPDEWFHASIVVTKDSIKVFVNHSVMPSLKVKRLVNTNDGMIGLWDDELSGDFANLSIKNDK